MKKLLTIAALFILLPFYSQNWWNKNTIKGNGVIKTETRNTSDYESISVSGSFEVQLTSGKEGNITVTGDENLLDIIITEVEGENLKIKFKTGSNVSYSKRILITVPVQEIEKLTLSGSGRISAENKLKSQNFSTTLSGSGKMNLVLDTQNLTSTLSGSGQLALQGTSENFDITISGSGKVNAKNFVSDTVTATISGSGNATVHSTETIKAVVSGSGQVNYAGNPKNIEEKVSGSGGINKV
jgi:Putative auto-transporter adhesin, head GIN domain